MDITSRLRILIRKFAVAQEILDDIDADLSAELAPILKETNDIPGLLQLSRALPDGYFGARFVYEKIAEVTKKGESK